MKFRVFHKLLLGLFFYSMVGCDGFQSSSVDGGLAVDVPSPAAIGDAAVRENPYQAGREWNRKLLEDASTVSRQVFQLYRYGMGAVGTGTYIGEIGGKHLVMTAAHTYKELSSCKDEVSFVAKSSDFDLYFYCSGWSFQLKDNDVLFFEIKSFEEGSLEKLRAAVFSEKKLNTGDQLKMLTIERLMPDFNFNWFVDDSSECILLRSHSRYLLDPDEGVQGSSTGKLASWSLPIGCDGKHGDSGAPIFDEESKIVGLLWTGKYPKTEASASLEFLSGSSVWSNFNYMVPFSKVAEELEAVVESEFYLSLETRSVLRGIKSAIKHEQDDYLGF